MIEVEALSKFYQMGKIRVEALKGVSFRIKKGEFLAVIGPSGSGKSTLMNLLGCLDSPTTGRYVLDGKDVSRLNANQLAEIRNQKIGFVFQGFNLLSKLTALENVELPLIYRGMAAAQRRQKARKALEQVGLADRIHHRPVELSGGQQQRVAIARALAGEPPLLLADEPTGNLDSSSGADVIELLRSLNRSGNTIILITHDPGVAAEARRVLRIRDGLLVADEEVSRV